MGAFKDRYSELRCDQDHLSRTEIGELCKLETFMASLASPQYSRERKADMEREFDAECAEDKRTDSTKIERTKSGRYIAMSIPCESCGGVPDLVGDHATQEDAQSALDSAEGFGICRRDFILCFDEDGVRFVKETELD